ncbi:MAG: Wzz/FepE/Etk N-terminal domain-containing protein [Tannerellaceae bacterium]
METNEIKPQTPPKREVEQEIDLIELAQKLWGKRKFLLKLGGIAIVVGLVVAFSIPKEYTTTVKLAPEMESASKKMGNLGGLAAMAGIDLNSSAGADAISPDLYPDVVQSTPFLLELFPISVVEKEGKQPMTLYDYMDKHQRSAWWSYVLSAPFKLLNASKNLFAETEKGSSELNPFHLNNDQEEIVKALGKRISISVDKKTLVITASVQMQDPVISAEITKVVVEKLQNYITTYRTQKVKQDLEFTQKVFGEARESYYKAQQAYAAFEDGNRNIISSSYRTEQERLKNEMTLTFNVYNTLAQKLEQDKLRVQEQTPVYTVIEPAMVPLQASSPKKAMILIGFLFLGIVGGIGYLFAIDLFLPKKNEMVAE